MPRNISADLADKYGFTLVLLGLDDARSIVNGERKRWGIAKDGMIAKQFGTAAERFEWLEEYQTLRELPKRPDTKPMKL